MLQESVDALFDNGRRGRPVSGRGGRPLKSLAEALKGKQGRFRQNLLGRRVDYSGRSVIVTTPSCCCTSVVCPRPWRWSSSSLRHEAPGRAWQGREHQGRQARYRPWCHLCVGHPRRVIDGRVVLLNRAPTLHRLSIQAFEPGAGRGQGYPPAPAGLLALQRRLRRRPDVRPRAAVQPGSGRGPRAHALCEQPALAGIRQAGQHPLAGHDHRCVLPHPGPRRSAGREPRVRQLRRRAARL